MGFSMDISVPVLTVFLQGLLSFFSPCVLPLLPLYIGYLSGGTARRGEDGRITYERKKVMLHTVFFVLGVSSAFFILGLGGSALGRFFKGNQAMFARIGGIFVAGFGLYQLGIFGPSRLLSREHRLPFSVGTAAMSPVTAFLLGFTFSFAWTPCVGPALASVLLMAASAATQARGFLLIGVYTAGFVLPFLAVGMFSTTLLDVFKRHGNVVTYAARAGAVLMILMGVMMFTGWMNGITGYLSSFGVGGQTVTESQTPAGGDSGTAEGKETAPQTEAQGPSDNGQNPDQSAGQGTDSSQDPAGSAAGDASETDSSLPDTSDRVEAPDFTLVDQYGEEHTLSDYKGKVVFLNFWATWCPPCREEMPDIEALYKEYGENSEDLVILSVANPKTKDNPNNNDKTIEEVTKFMEDNGYSYPALMDTTGDVLLQYYITAFPTTFMIDREGRVIGYANGALTKDIMKNIITQALSESAE